MNDNTSKTIGTINNLIKTLSAETKLIGFSFIILTSYWFVSIDYFANSFFVSRPEWIILIYSFVLATSWYTVAILMAVVTIIMSFPISYLSNEENDFEDASFIALFSGIGALAFIVLNIVIAIAYFKHKDFDFILTWGFLGYIIKLIPDIIYLVVLIVKRLISFVPK